ncbi:MAG: peptidase M75 [Polyangiaceae bacterium]|nr:peptidase M75 [Polyangiaceae bacterium]
MRRVNTLALCTLGLALLHCGGSDEAPGTDGGFDGWSKSQTVVVDYTDKVVVGTYELLATRLHALSAAAAALKAAPTEANLESARQAWVDARKPWEQSEAFLFGPVDAKGFDPALDSWPVNRTDLDGVLASKDELTPAYVKNLDPTLRGFHTAEYLIYGVDSKKAAAALTPRELDYLSAVTGNMASVADELVSAWKVGPDAYADVLKGAGKNSVYPSRQSAAEEIVRGMIAIADEVANGKIADPVEQKDPNLVESQFSFNSLADFADNVRSIQNAYTGDNPDAGSTGVGLDEWIAELDPALDQRVKQEIADSLAALGAIPPPFSTALTSPDAAGQISAAQTTIRTLQSTLEKDVLPKIVD